MDVAERLRAEGIPSSAIWTEDWIGGQQGLTGYSLTYSWDWDQTLYPDLPEMIDTLHSIGFAFLGYFNPFVPDTTQMWTEGVESGLLVKNEQGETYEVLDPFFRTTGLVDLTNPDARAWLRGWQTGRRSRR